MKTQQKFSHVTKEAVLAAYARMCANEGCFEWATEFHHILPNTKPNVKNYPLYLQSPFNCFPICHGCHMNKPLPPKPSYNMVSYFEKYLKGLAND